MAPATPATDPALANPTAQGSQPTSLPAGIPPNLSASELSDMALRGLDQNQILTLLRNLPVFAKLTEQGQANPKEDAAQILSNLHQAQAQFGQPLQVHYQTPGSVPAPNLGQLSAVAMQAAPASVQQTQGQQVAQVPRPEDAAAQNAVGSSSELADGTQGASATPSTSTPSAGRRNNRAVLGDDEWTRQRKDNHKEVERRRRGNINEGINELGRIVPSGSGEKAKGAILARAVQYIHHLKENEARNIEKWTLEKLLMDQAMGDLQNQLEEVKRMWEEERMARTRLEAELEVLRTGKAGAASPADAAAASKRKSVETESTAEETEAEREGKRQRTD